MRVGRSAQHIEKPRPAIPSMLEVCFRSFLNCAAKPAHGQVTQPGTKRPGTKRPGTKVMRPRTALGPCKPARHAHQGGHDGPNRRTQANDDHLGLWNLAKRHPQGADPPGHGILRGTGVSQQSTAAKPAKHNSTARKTLSYTKHPQNIVIHKTYKPSLLAGVPFCVPPPLPSPSLLLPLPPCWLGLSWQP